MISASFIVIMFRSVTIMRRSRFTLITVKVCVRLRLCVYLQHVLVNKSFQHNFTTAPLKIEPVHIGLEQASVSSLASKNYAYNDVRQFIHTQAHKFSSDKFKLCAISKF